MILEQRSKAAVMCSQTRQGPGKKSGRDRGEGWEIKEREDKGTKTQFILRPQEVRKRPARSHSTRRPPTTSIITMPSDSPTFNIIQMISGIIKMADSLLQSWRL